MNMHFDIKTDTLDLALLEAIQDGLPLTSKPFAVIAKQLLITEDEIISRFERLQNAGIIKRFGLVLQHRPLGFRANAMVVWDVPDEEVNAAAERITAHDFVTLCYCRARRAPVWQYNLYCMIHGRERQIVEGQIAELKRSADLIRYPTTTLFSTRRFKQTGARFSSSTKRMKSAP